MKKSIVLYYLYCLNVHCNVSIYHRNVEVRMPLTPENLLTKHTCPCCNKGLSSAIDLEIKQLAANASSSGKLKWPAYLFN